jgi:uncharacterized protein (TIGR03437 family)
MHFSPRGFCAIISVALAAACSAATFGTVVPMRGTISDIALDQRRGHLYAANFTANRIEVMRTSDRTILDPLPVPKPPSSVAMSPDNRFLIVAEFAPPSSDPVKGGFTIFDLDAGTRQDVQVDGNALAAAFGAGSKALLVTTNGFFLVDPYSADTTQISPTSLASLNLPVALATFPPQIVQANAGVSGDGNTIVVLAAASSSGSATGDASNGTSADVSAIARYNVTTGSLSVDVFTASPSLGPREVSVDQDATNVLAGWGLLHYLSDGLQGDACNRQVITQTLDVVDLGNAGADFTLSVPSGTKGVRILTPSGTAPAKVQIQVDPVAFQNVKGTTTIPLTITSSRGVNLPNPVRLLINTRDLNQRGTILDIPGKLVDMLADPLRNRVYVIRQDKNEVLVFDAAALPNASTATPIATLRTGNTPVSMSMTTDNKYLIVGNDNSQIASVFDLDTLKPSDPILFPFGHYPRSIGVSGTGIFATFRPVSGDTALDQIDFTNRTATTPPSLGIYTNVLPSANGALAESPDHGSLVLALPDGNVLLYDTSAAEWVASRKDLMSPGGGLGAFSNSLFLAGGSVLDQALVPVATLSDASASAGVAVAAGAGLYVTAGSAAGPGQIERVDLNTLQPFHATALTEAPLQSATLMTPPVGQIGETILPFLRTVAIPADQSSILVLSVSGLTVLTPNFDAVTQVPVISSVTNAADGGTNVAPGGLIQVAGVGLAPAPAAAKGLPLPSALGDACVTVNEVALPLFSVSSSAIMAQLPFVPAGAATVIVRSPGGISAAYPFTILGAAPAIFHSGSAGSNTGLATVVRDDNQDFVNFTNPLHPGSHVTIYLTGMGTTSPAAPLGDAAPSDPLAVVASQPTVTLGASSLDVSYAGLTPGEVGVYQINVTVPENIQQGTSVPLTITQESQSTVFPVRVVNP